MSEKQYNQEIVNDIKQWQDHLNYVLGPIGVCAAISLRNNPNTTDALLYLMTMIVFAYFKFNSLKSEIFVLNTKTKRHEKYNLMVLLQHYKEFYKLKFATGYLFGIASLLLVIWVAR
jgi:hypothetical protein